MNYDHPEIWFSAIHAPNLLSVWQIHFEFEHFIATVLISVISMKNHQISKQTKLQIKCDQSQIWIQCNKCTKFYERLTNTLRIWTFHSNCPYISHLNIELPDNTVTKLQTICDQSQIWIQCNKCTKFIERLTNTLRIGTFHCNCPYITYLNIELPDNTATKHQTICDQSQIWIQCNKCTKFIERLTNTLRIWTFHCNWSISVILMKNYQITLQLNFKWITSIQKFDSAQYMHQINWAFDKYTSNLNISLQLIYFSHLNIELPDNTATKLQTICDQSQIWIQCNKCTKFIERLTNTLRIWTFHCNWSISVILI